jgi:hypothetical protein
MRDKEALKLALDDLMVEYDMERTSFAKRVDEIFKQATPEQPSPMTSLQARALDKMAENARELGLGLDYEPAPVQPAAWESEMRSELAKLGFEGQCPESIGITIKGWFDAYAKSLTAQPAPEQQKPVAWMYQCTADTSGPVLLQHRTNWAESGTGLWIETPLYITPPAQLAPVQEPFEYWNAVEGWVRIDEVREHFGSVGCGTIYKTAGEGRVPLTAAQRQWVGLTNKGRKAIYDECQGLDVMKAIIQTEAKLKEKNT